MKIEQRNQAIILRRKGYSLKEISVKVGVSKSTASNWLKDIVLDDAGKVRLEKRITKGQINAASRKREKTKNLLQEFQKRANEFVGHIAIDRDLKKIICSLIYWCEGGKFDHRFVQFTNSDPSLVSTFLYLLRQSFNLNESKFRGCIHLHSYHGAKEQLLFWSNITGIPENQFFKPFQKRNIGKRIREGYQGCIMIKYYDAKIVRELLSVARAFMKKYRGVR